MLKFGRRMGSRRPTAAQIVAELVAVKLLVKSLSDAMPALAHEIRRDACERIDDIISDIGNLRR